MTPVCPHVYDEHMADEKDLVGAVAVGALREAGDVVVPMPPIPPNPVVPKPPRSGDFFSEHLRAAEVIAQTQRAWTDMAPMYDNEATELAEALADADLLLSDVDRAVLDAADAYVSEDGRGVYTYDRDLHHDLTAAVRARRDAS